MKSVYLAIKCTDCGDAIISRAHHDFNACSCDPKNGKGIFIDGNSLVSTDDPNNSIKSYYVRMGGDHTKMESFHVTLPMSPRDVYKDWNGRIDKLAKIDTTIYNLEKIEV